MPRMKLPTQPKTCAWPCAWSQAGEMEATLSRPLICRRFQTPRNVPGNSIKKSPELTNAIRRRDSDSSRARACRNTSVGARVGQLDAGDRMAVSVTDTWAPLRLAPPLLAQRPVERECCSLGVHEGADLSRTLQDLDRLPGSSRKRPSEPCIRRSLRESAAPTRRHCRVLSSSNRSDSSRSERKEARPFRFRSPHFPASQ